MRIRIFIMLLFVMLLQDVTAQNTDTIPDETIDTTTTEMDGLIFSDDGEEVALGNFWDLIGQAGPIRYPIFGIFLVGVFLISIKTFDLIMDKRQAVNLETASVQTMNLNELFDMVTVQTDHMLSRISSTILNVFNTSKNTENLHDEVVNYVQFQQDNFGTFRNRIDFLSDTAGALGLLGTVWGMFIVFSSGNLEKEIILTGMGIALLTTLLGLIVSIALNFASTLTQGYFMKRLDQVKSKAEEIRFRLLEIEDRRKTAKTPKPVTNSNHAVLTGLDSDLNNHNQNNSEQEDVEVVEKVEPAYLKIHSDLREATAGSNLKDIKVSVTDKNNGPVQNVIFYASVVDGNGKLDKTELITDSSGNAYLNWRLGQLAGRQAIEAKVDGSNDSALSQKFIVQSTAGEPKDLALKANNQSGLPGKKLKKPLVAVVKDEYGNPVEGCNVHLEITTGNGKLGYGKESVVLPTNREGQISISFTLDQKPGFNVVDVSIKKAGIYEKYQAMGQEVLA
ncbi:MAG: MotA/TolQ/ExbB proton channel family protein [Balneolales bacterium]